MATTAQPLSGTGVADVGHPAPPTPEGALIRNLRTIGMVWKREIIRFRRTPARIVSGLAQPILFLFVLGAGIKPLVGQNSAGGVDYQQFILPGVMAMSVLFSSLFSAISIVWDREFGFLREMLVAPVSRAGLVLGKAAGSGTVAAGQGLILLIAAPIVGVHLNALQIIEVIPLLMLLAFALTAFGIVIASRMQRMESFQMVMGLVVNPMLFLSGAIFPLAGLATWLAVVTRLNPATYGIDPIRRVMLGEHDAAPLTINGWVVQPHRAGNSLLAEHRSGPSVRRHRAVRLGRQDGARRKCRATQHDGGRVRRQRLDAVHAGLPDTRSGPSEVRGRHGSTEAGRGRADPVGRPARVPRPCSRRPRPLLVGAAVRRRSLPAV